jgi:hypothetical protein
MMAYEENSSALREKAPDVATLPANFDWFLPQLAVGDDGLLSGIASLTPRLPQMPVARDVEDTVIEAIWRCGLSS